MCVFIRGEAGKEVYTKGSNLRSSERSGNLFGIRPIKVTGVGVGSRQRAQRGRRKPGIFREQKEGQNGEQLLLEGVDGVSNK